MFRFNRDIDTESQINFGDHNDLEGLKKAIDDMPKNGGGWLMVAADQPTQMLTLQYFPSQARLLGKHCVTFATTYSNTLPTAVMWEICYGY